MLVFDTSLLSDYLHGTESARTFLKAREQQEWAVPTIVQYEATMGVLYGHIDCSVERVKESMHASFTMLETTPDTVGEAIEIQQALLDSGTPLEPLDTLIAASAREHDGSLATADQQFWRPSVKSVIPVERYEPST